MKIELFSNSEEETIKLGASISKFLKPGDLVLLYGDLGCGKTTLVKGIAQGLMVDPEIYVTSPSFSLVNIYNGKYTIYHIDLYRLESIEIEELGIYEFLNEGIVVIEWADKLSHVITLDFLEFHFEVIDLNKRKILITGYGEWQELLAKLDMDEILASR